MRFRSIHPPCVGQATPVQAAPHAGFNTQTTLSNLGESYWCAKMVRGIPAQPQAHKWAD